MNEHHHHHHHKQEEHPRRDEAGFHDHFGSGAPLPPPGPFAESYRIAGYQDGLVAATPECELLLPEFDSGLEFGDEDNDQPGDWLMDGGVLGGVTWDGTFYRDLARYSGSGPLFWASYLKGGTEAGMKKGFWFNFGSGWSHLFNDDPAQILGGASQKLFWEPVAGTAGAGLPGSATPATGGRWKLVIEATVFLTFEVVVVWSGVKIGGSDPSGIYERESGLDPLASLTIEAV